jgi:flagellar hook-associated protein 1 FlgK
MASLFSIIGNTSDALAAQSAQLAATAKNIANVDNPNYAREYVVLDEGRDVSISGTVLGVGLQARSIQQYASPLLDQQLRQENSLTSMYSSQQTVLQDAQSALGQSLTSSASSSAASTSTSAGDTGLASAMDRFQADLEALAANPTDPGTRQALVEDTGTLTDTFHQVDSNLAQVQTNATTQVTNSVTQANTLLANIAGLNTQIVAFENGAPGTAVSLRDSRRADLQQLSALLPITASEQSDGSVTITTPDTGGTGVTLLQRGAVQGGVAYANGTLTGGASATALGLSSGSIAGAITAATGPVQTLRDQLNALASQFVTSMNAAYNPSSTAGGNFFLGSGTTAATIAADPNLTAAGLTTGPNGAGDNTIIEAMANLGNTTFSSGSGQSITGTFASFYAGAVGQLGQTLSSANSDLQDQQNIQSMVQSQQSSLSGVNLDEEMSNLVQFQQAYQANAQIFSLLNSLTSTVLTALGTSTG